MINNKTSDVDVTILGAGIAGLSIADSLLLRHKSVAIVDTGSPGGGSSGAPIILINPATGRRAKRVKDAEACIAYAEDLLERTATFSDDSFYAKNGVLRPALTPELAADFKRSPGKYNWPDTDWIYWKDQHEFNASYPYFGKHFGGLEIPAAFTVEAATYIQLLISFLRRKGLYTHLDTDFSIENSANDPFTIHLEADRSFSTNIIIYAVGSGIRHLPEWKFLPASYIKGQLLDLSFTEPLPLKQSVSSMGYFAFNPKNPGRLVVGSTYEHHYDHLQTDKKGEEYLYEKLERTLPGFHNRSHSSSMWAGERVSMADHKPVAGRHPVLSGRYILGGLGSKGMIYSRYLAELLTNYIIEGKPVDPEFSTERFWKS